MYIKVWASPTYFQQRARTGWKSRWGVPGISFMRISGVALVSGAWNLLRRRWLTYICTYTHTHIHGYVHAEGPPPGPFHPLHTRKYVMFAEAMVRSSKSGTKIECMIHWLIFGAILGPSWGYLGAIVGPTYIGHLGLHILGQKRGGRGLGQRASVHSFDSRFGAQNWSKGCPKSSTQKNSSVFGIIFVEGFGAIRYVYIHTYVHTYIHMYIGASWQSS